MPIRQQQKQYRLTCRLQEQSADANIQIEICIEAAAAK